MHQSLAEYINRIKGEPKTERIKSQRLNVGGSIEFLSIFNAGDWADSIIRVTQKKENI